METTSVPDRFLAILRQKHNEGCTREQFTAEEYFNVTESMKSTRKKTQRDFLQPQEVSCFHITSETASIFWRRESADDPPLFYIPMEEMFEVIKRARLATGHGGRDRMLHELGKKYENVSIEAMNLYKSFCAECQEKKKRAMVKGVVVKPILTKEFQSRGQVDLIDMQSLAESSYKWITVYQDHLTKFCVMRALE